MTARIEDRPVRLAGCRCNAGLSLRERLHQRLSDRGWEPSTSNANDTDWTFSESIIGDAWGTHVFQTLIEVSEDSDDIQVRYASPALWDGWCEKHRPAMHFYPLTAQGVEALDAALPGIESYAIDGDEAAKCVTAGECSRSKSALASQAKEDRAQAWYESLPPELQARSARALATLAEGELGLNAETVRKHLRKIRKAQSS
ncbi:hypothetical protein ACJ6WD_35355 [Streptomyces sp. VTCC 41912]|uniref:hypothetical protein n=1 Tax=Streptomyces sp. VTCC 41912 TaxID=3383243 RepID=UPI003896B26E